MGTRLHRKVLDRAAAVLAIVGWAACGPGAASDDASVPAPGTAPVKTAAQALEGAQIPQLDPANLTDAEIGRVIGSRPRCTFRYTSSGRPVFVAGLMPDGSPALGVVKLNGNLVALQPDSAAAGAAHGGFALTAQSVRLSVQPKASTPSGEGRAEADMVFEVNPGLKVGYAGYLDCGRAR